MHGSNILFIVVDTLREDYSDDLWERLERKGFKKYENVIATSSWTTPSHASIFTGKYPIVHGAHATKEKKTDLVKLKSGAQLTHDLKEQGYDCHLLSANPYVSKYFGFTGFDSHYEILYTPELKLVSNREWDIISGYRERGHSLGKMIKELSKEGNYSLICRSGLQKFGIEKVLNLFSSIYWRFIGNWPMEKGSKRILKRYNELIRTKGKAPKFIFINLMEVHEPYFQKKLMKYIHNFNRAEYEKDINERIIEKLKTAYRKEIDYSNGSIEKMLKKLEGTADMENTLIIITSDHGQLFGEHDKVGHGVFLYDELLRLPLFIRYPKRSKLPESDRSQANYISLVNFRDFILGTLKNDTVPEDKLYSDHAVAESHGINIDLKFPVDDDIVKDLDKLRLSIHYRGAQGIFDVGKWKFDSIVSQDGSKVDDDIEKGMRARIVNHLKKGTRNRLMTKGLMKNA